MIFLHLTGHHPRLRASRVLKNLTRSWRSGSAIKSTCSLTEDQSLVLSTQVKRFTTACNSSSRGTDIFASIETCTQTHILTRRHTQSYTHLINLKKYSNWAWWCSVLTPALRSQRQADSEEFKARLVCTVRPCLKRTNK